VVVSSFLLRKERKSRGMSVRTDEEVALILFVPIFPISGYLFNLENTHHSAVQPGGSGGPGDAILLLAYDQVQLLGSSAGHTECID
jgi:hypothetical protein